MNTPTRQVKKPTSEYICIVGQSWAEATVGRGASLDAAFADATAIWQRIAGDDEHLDPDCCDFFHGTLVPVSFTETRSISFKEKHEHSA